MTGFTYCYINGSTSIIIENIFTNTFFYKLFRVRKYCRGLSGGGGGGVLVGGHRGGRYGSPGLVGNGSRRLSPSGTGASAGVGWVPAALYTAVGVGVD